MEEGAHENPPDGSRRTDVALCLLGGGVEDAGHDIPLLLEGLERGKQCPAACTAFPLDEPDQLPHRAAGELAEIPPRRRSLDEGELHHHRRHTYAARRTQLMNRGCAAHPHEGCGLHRLPHDGEGHRDL